MTPRERVETLVDVVMFAAFCAMVVALLFGWGS